MADLPDIIERVAGNVVFSSDEKYVFYTWLDENHRPCKIKRHKIGSNPESDETVLCRARYWLFCRGR